jgi:hypothetical protein
MQENSTHLLFLAYLSQIHIIRRPTGLAPAGFRDTHFGGMDTPFSRMDSPRLLVSGLRAGLHNVEAQLADLPLAAGMVLSLVHSP